MSMVGRRPAPRPRRGGPIPGPAPDIFGEFPRRCPVCLDLSLGTRNDIFTIDALDGLNTGLAELDPRVSPNGDAVVFVAGAEQRRAFLHLGDFVGPIDVTGPEWHVQSASFAGLIQRVIVSARPADQPDAPYQLLVYDVMQERYEPITTGPASKREVDFGR